MKRNKYQTFSDSDLNSFVTLWESSTLPRIIDDYNLYKQALKEDTSRNPQHEALNLIKLTYYNNFPSATNIEFDNYLKELNDES